MSPDKPEYPGSHESGERTGQTRDTNRIRGGCLCGGVRFEIKGRFLRAGHCHCSRCRKHSGAAASTQGRIAKGDFELIEGAPLVRAYRTPGHDTKAFCTVCGSSLFGGDWPGGDEVSVRLGALDDDPGIRPQYHTFVGSVASWDTITDDLPQHHERLPQQWTQDLDGL